MYIIIEAQYSSYREIKLILENAGLKEFDIFIWYCMLDKKITVLYGNCHLNPLVNMLEKNSNFSACYFVHSKYLICEHPVFDENLLKHCDLFIYQYITANNKFGEYYSSDAVLDKIGEQVLRISVPNLYGLGEAFFPFSYPNDGNSLLNGDEGIFPRGDMAIDYAIASGMDIADTISFDKYVLLSKEYIKEMFDIQMKKIKSYEKMWDVKIYDFLIKNYRNKKLFFDPGHPTIIVIDEIYRQLLKILNIKYEPHLCVSELDDRELFVYPELIETLGLRFCDVENRKSKSSRKLDEKMYINQYIEEYIFCMVGNRT